MGDSLRVNVEGDSSRAWRYPEAIGLVMLSSSLRHTQKPNRQGNQTTLTRLPSSKSSIVSEFSMLTCVVGVVRPRSMK
eukprot:1596203-Amphidinium_carterae.1